MSQRKNEKGETEEWSKGIADLTDRSLRPGSRVHSTQPIGGDHTHNTETHDRGMHSDDMRRRPPPLTPSLFTATDLASARLDRLPAVSALPLLAPTSSVMSADQCLSGMAMIKVMREVRSLVESPPEGIKVSTQQRQRQRQR